MNYYGALSVGGDAGPEPGRGHVSGGQGRAVILKPAANGAKTILIWHLETKGRGT